VAIATLCLCYNRCAGATTLLASDTTGFLLRRRTQAFPGTYGIALYAASFFFVALFACRRWHQKKVSNAMPTLAFLFFALLFFFLLFSVLLVLLPFSIF
jgi:hypothetical protein